jgi:hypothetical protein
MISLLFKSRVWISNALTIALSPPNKNHLYICCKGLKKGFKSMDLNKNKKRKDYKTLPWTKCLNHVYSLSVESCTLWSLWIDFILYHTCQSKLLVNEICFLCLVTFWTSRLNIKSSRCCQNIFAFLYTRTFNGYYITIYRL